MSAPAIFPCGHSRVGSNAQVFKHKLSPGGTATRCRQCNIAAMTAPHRAGAGALRLVARLHAEGVLSEGQVAEATGMDRVAIRRLVDRIMSA